MDLKLQGRVAVVTGASKGIGLAVVKGLAAEGVTVVAGARHVDGELTALAEQGSVVPVAVDLSRPEAPQQLVERAAKFGRLDILVNNVGAVRDHAAGRGLQR